jgi:hypothetical protein
MLGPIDYIIVGIKGNNFDGSVLEELKKAVDSGVIRLVDLLFVIKDKDGEVTMAEVTDQDDDLKQVAEVLGHKDDMPLLTESDTQKIAEKMKRLNKLLRKEYHHDWQTTYTNVRRRC